MTEENPENKSLHSKAVKIVQMLIDFGQPKDASELTIWLKKVKILQALLENYWQGDPSGRVMVQCLTLLYTVIALNLSQVGPAVWSILDLVEEEKISEFVDGFLSDPNTNDNSKVQNVLIALIGGLSQLAPHTFRLQNWILAIVKGLEARKNFTVLVHVSENVISKLMQLLLIPTYRPLIYPTFKQFLYQVVTPHVFYKILDKVPGTLSCLENDNESYETKAILLDFAGTINAQLDRFPPEPENEAYYKVIKSVLKKYPEKTPNPTGMTLCEPEHYNGSSGWSSDSGESEECILQMPYKGLLNQGNTCFMNSVLQILFMTTRFRKELLEKELDFTETAASDLQELFAFMLESDRKVLNPERLIDSTLPFAFRRGTQQDSSEYLIYLLDLLHENEKKVIGIGEMDFCGFQNIVHRRAGNGDFNEEETLVERLFRGVSMSTTICSFCNKAFSKNDNFWNLYLSIPDEYVSCDLQELINNSLGAEELGDDDMYDCANCGTKRNAMRKYSITKAPEHLILTLKLFRFDPVRKQRLKLLCKLKEVQSIELPVYNSSQSETNTVMYDIKGVVLHAGSSLDGGHYFSAAVDETGQWFTFNDSFVYACSFKWYKRKGTPYVIILRQSHIGDPAVSPLSSSLQMLVNRDNRKFSSEKKMKQTTLGKKKDYEDDWDDAPPNDDSFGGPGPSLVF